MPPQNSLSKADAALSLPPELRVAHGLRDFARAVRHIHDLRTFLEIFQVGLESTGICARAEFSAEAADGADHRPNAFGAGRLSLPVVAEGRVAAIAQVTPPADKQHFGPEDLQLLAGLSELLGAAIELAYQIQRQDRVLEALKAVLNFAPVGICAFDEQGRVAAANTLARGWLALAEGDSLASALPAGTSWNEVRQGGSFHLRVSGRLLFCETRPHPDQRIGALVITDLTPEQGRLLDALNREVYRGNHLGRAMHFVLLERAQPMGALLSAMPVIRETMGRAAIVGPYDAARIGLIFPESTWSTVIRQLRRVAPALAPAEVRIGRAGLRSFTESPEQVIETALSAPDTLATVLRPRILVHDEYRGVGEALQLVFGPACDVTGSTDMVEAQRLVQEQHFDAVLADLNAAGGGQDLVARARARNRHVRAFFLSSTLPGALSGRMGTAADGPVFSKPFNVEAVRDRILAALGTSESTTEE